MRNIKFTNAQQAKVVYNIQNTKGKLLNPSAAICFNKIMQKPQINTEIYKCNKLVLILDGYRAVIHVRIEDAFKQIFASSSATPEM
jgi:hypothetical protein